jgi:Asp-tRNA(Asn)/Glu-tRNA(Gln) amidotransferase C subunit
MSNDNVVNMFKEKVSALPEGESTEETVARFHAKLDEVMDTFQQLSVMEKYEIMESVCTMNKNIFKLYWDLKKRHDFHMNNY